MFTGFTGTVFESANNFATAPTLTTEVKPDKSARKVAIEARAKAKAKKPVKKKVKAKVKVAKISKAKKGGKGKKSVASTSAEKRAAHARNLKQSKMRAKKEPNESERRVIRAFSKVGRRLTLADLVERVFKNVKPAARAHSHARNNIRFGVDSGKLKKVDRGTYERVA
jgi:hypothetical protein